MATPDFADWHTFLPLLVAPFVGSFLGVLIDRLPVGEGVVRGRSRCPHCGELLGFRDLVPLLSWLMHRGRCRFCGVSLGIFYPAVELMALGVALWAILMLDGWLVWVTAGFGWALLALGWIDRRHLLLPDVLALPLLPAGLAVIYFANPARLLDHLVGAAAAFVAMLAIGWLYRRLRGREGLGRGDAKLLAGLGAWVGWQGLGSVVLIACATGLAELLLRAIRGERLSAVDKLAFGTHLCIGGWLVWLYGPLVLHV